MAKIYPEISTDFHNSLGEFKIFEALKKMSDEWNIYYSVNWHKRENNGRVRWGEADFLIFSPKKGILVIEVKSGGIKFENGKWIQRRLDTLEEFTMKNPFIQADRSKFTILENIENCMLFGDKCFVDKAVWFPSINKEKLRQIQLPMEYNRNLILTEEDLQNSENALNNIFKFYKADLYTKLSKNSIEIIKNIIMPNFNLVPSASNIKGEADYVFYQLTNEQKKVLDFIDGQNSVAIQGAAGTGKTFIAVEQAKRFASKGKVLFLCFNKYLNQHLKNKCAIKNVDYYTLHSFLSQNSNGEDVYETSTCVRILEYINFFDKGYKYIIIDESQDFEKDIIRLIYNKAVENNIKIVIFYDKNQLIFQNDLPDVIKNFDCKLTLLKNCRNTVKITSSVNSIFEIPINVNELTIVGTMPQIHYSLYKDKIIASLIKTINNYIENGYEIEDITILTLETTEKSILNKKTNLGKYRISDVKENDTLFFTTSKKFKGLESNIIIVVDFNPQLFNDEIYKRNLYVSFSRARQKLDVFSVTSQTEIDNMLNNWDDSIRSITQMGRKLKMMIDNIDK